MPDLPNELVAHVLSFLAVMDEDAPIDQQDTQDRVDMDTLAACCLASRSLLALARERLYHTLSFMYIAGRAQAVDLQLPVPTPPVPEDPEEPLLLRLEEPSAYDTLAAGVGGRHARKLILGVDATDTPLSAISSTTLQPLFASVMGRLFDLCPNVSSLVVYEGYGWQLGGILKASPNLVHQIQEFTLREFDSLNQVDQHTALRSIVKMLLAMPRLEKLRLDFHGTMFELARPVTLKAQLRTLVLGSTTSKMFDFLASSSISTLTSLTITLPLDAELDLTLFTNLAEVSIQSTPLVHHQRRPPSNPLPVPFWKPPIPSHIRHLNLDDVSILYDLPHIPTNLQQLSLYVSPDPLPTGFKARAYPPPRFFERLIALVQSSPHLQSLDLNLQEDADGLEEIAYPSAAKARLKALCEEKGIELSDLVADGMDGYEARVTSSEGSVVSAELAASASSSE